MIYFICGSPLHGSTEFRGAQLAAEINRVMPSSAAVAVGAEAFELIRAARNSLLIPILTVGEGLDYFFSNSAELMAECQKTNWIVPDILDSFCWPQHNPFFSNALASLFKGLNGVIVHNDYSQSLIKQSFNIEAYIVPHQWDRMYQALNDFERRYYNLDMHACYVGGPPGFQEDPEKFDDIVDFYFDYRETKLQLEYAIHVSYRKSNTLDYYFKPCAKLATAVGCHSLLVTSRDKSVVHLLGDSWPYYAETGEEVREKFFLAKNDLRKYGIEHFKTIHNVRRALSPSTISNKIIQIYQTLTAAR